MLEDLGVEDGVHADMTILELEGLEEDVDVVETDLGNHRFVRIDPPGPHPGFLSHDPIAIESARGRWGASVRGSRRIFP